MAGELRAFDAAGLTVKAKILNSAGKAWNGSAFETYSGSNVANYGVTMTEQGSSGTYVGDIPIALVTPGHYEYFCYSVQATNLAEDDPRVGTGSFDIDNTGSVDSESISGAMSGTDWLAYVIRVLKRTDKEDEIFDATKDVIDDMRRRIVFPENETQADVTDTIDTLGDYRMDVEDDFGTLITDVVLVDGNFGKPLEKISKREYDRRYTGFGTGASARNRPVAFCLFGGQILIGPVPDSVSYVYKISYGADSLASYDVDSAAIPFTDKYRLTLRRGVLSLLFSEILKNDEQGAKFGTLYEGDLKQIERRIDRNRKSTSQTQYQGV